MIEKLFDIPSRYYVIRTIDKDNFVKKASLSLTEKREIDTQISSVGILYDLKFRNNSEAFIIEVNTKILYRKDSMATIAKAIASSIPYYTIVLVKYDNYMRVVFLNTKNNSKDESRKVVLNYSCSDIINLNKLNSFDFCLFDDISSAFSESDSDEQFARIISEFAFELRNTRTERKQIKKIIYPESEYTDLIKKVYCCSGAFDDYILDDNDSQYNDYYVYNQKSRFVSDCGNYSYGLLLEFAEQSSSFLSNPGIEDEDSVAQKWLEFYIDKCLEFGQEMENIILTENDIIKIIELFKEKLDYRVRDYKSEYFEADDLRMYIEQDSNELGEVFGVYFGFSPFICDDNE